MLQFKIVPTILLRGHAFPFKFLVKTIGMGRGKASKFVQDSNQSITLADLSELCRHLHCTPNDLLYWQHSDTRSLPPGHPCSLELKAPAATDSWQKAIQQLSPEQAQEILAQIQEAGKQNK